MVHFQSVIRSERSAHSRMPQAFHRLAARLWVWLLPVPEFLDDCRSLVFWQAENGALDGAAKVFVLDILKSQLRRRVRYDVTKHDVLISSGGRRVQLNYTPRSGQGNDP